MPSEQQRSTTPENERDRWRTPPAVKWWADQRYGLHDVDIAADADNKLCAHYIDRDADALARPLSWPDRYRNAWCNPPYSKRADWFALATNAVASGCSVTLLVPAPNGENYWYDHAMNCAATEIVFIAGRLAYLRPNGEAVNGNRFGSVLVRYNADAPQRIGAQLESVQLSVIKAQYNYATNQGAPRC